MDCFDLDRYHVADGQVRELIAAGQPRAAAEVARASITRLRAETAGAGVDGDHAPEQLAAALCDLAACRLAAGDVAGAVRTIQEALQVCPASQVAFHSLASILWQQRQLRGRNFASVRQLLRDRLPRLPWAEGYRRLLYQPEFLNVQFVAGKCNLKCRMCVGINAPEHPDRLSVLDVELFEQMLEAAPTIEGLTLSAADSDPLLHPRLGEIIEIARARGVVLDIFTNGLPLGTRMARAIVESGVVSMVNFSIDAATAETYRRIRGADLGRLLPKIEMLRDLKRDLDARRPVLSLSFVAMADNIHELPAFVALARRLQARRVFVGDLIGWLEESHGNVPATEHPHCGRYVAEARRIAEAADLELSLPEALQRTGERDSERAPHECCSWINGVWVSGDGSLQPCCLISGVADMGHVADGPLLRNDKYARVKEQLLTGKVFRPCAEQRMCQYVQEQHTAGRPLRFIEQDDLGELWVEPDDRQRPVALTVDGSVAATARV